jgi:hypothetical protein
MLVRTVGDGAKATPKQRGKTTPAETNFERSSIKLANSFL